MALGLGRTILTRTEGGDLCLQGSQRPCGSSAFHCLTSYFAALQMICSGQLLPFKAVKQWQS